MPDPSPASPISGSSGADLGRRWLRTDTVLLTALLGLFVWIAGDVLLLVSAGLLLAVGLDGLARPVKGWTPLSHGCALLVVSILTLIFLAVVSMTVVPQFLGQLDQLWQTLVEFAERIQEALSRYDWAQRLMRDGEEGSIASTIAQRAASAMLAVIGVMSSLIILLAIAIFAAVNPALYRRGLLTLVSPARRARVDQTLTAAAYVLRWWFLGQLISMLVLGVTVGVGLLIIGVDLWLSLAVLTALFTFIPFLGPIIAAVPILIVGFAEGIQTGMIVLIFYLVVQNLEGNFLVPLIHQRVVDLAPVLLISVQVLMSTLFGVMGLVMAAPLTLVAMITVKKLYVEDMLGEPQSEP